MTQEDYIDQAESERHRTTLETQKKQSLTNDWVWCGDCGHPVKIELGFRCLYCGIRYCFNCGEKHFGQTRLEWKKEKRVEARRKAEKR